jgi:hypothetical protein
MHQNTEMPIYPPLKPGTSDGLIQVIAVRLDNLHEDVSGMRDVLKELATAVTKLAIIEERQGQAAQALERAFGVLEKLEKSVAENKKAVEDRLSILEKAQPLQQEKNKWVDLGVSALVFGAVMFIGKKIGFL